MNAFSVFSAQELPANWPQNVIAAGSRASFGNAKQPELQTQLLTKLQLPNHALYTCQQTHSANVALAENSSPKIFEDTDGLISNRAQTALGIYSADCMPVLITSTNGKIIGLVHAGWRGMAQQIVLAALQKMQQLSRRGAQDFLVFSAPHIQSCCYQVTGELRANFDASCFQSKNDRLYFSLKTALALQLADFGLPKQNYRAHADCSFCAPNYHSFRRDKTADRMISILARQ